MNFYKKGQTEDITDLVVAIVIIIISLYLLNNMSSTHEINTQEKASGVMRNLVGSINFISYLKSPIETLNGQAGKCASQRSTTADVISQIDPIKAKNSEDDCYNLLTDITYNFNMNYFKTSGSLSMGPDFKTCFAIKLEFPSEQITLDLSLRCTQESPNYQNIILPLKNGNYVNIKYSKGIMQAQDTEQIKPEAIA